MNFHPFGRAAAAAAAMLLLAGTSAAAAAFAADDAPSGAGTESEAPVLPEEFTALSYEYAGNTGFIADGLHYSDSTLLTLTEYIAGFQMTEPGKATMFGTVMDPETVRDDAAMLAAGFTEDDLAAIRRGEDVTYAVRYEMENARSYADLAKKSPEKKKIDAFFSGKEQHPEDSLLTSYYAVRKCGDAEPEVLEGIQNVPGAVALGLLPEQGDVNDFVANGSFTMLYLAGEQAVSVPASASANENGYVLIQFEYLGSGDYIVLYEASEEPEQEPDSPAKQEEKHTPAPKTGDAGVHTAMLTALAAAAAAFAAARRADTKQSIRKKEKTR